MKNARIVYASAREIYKALDLQVNGNCGTYLIAGCLYTYASRSHVDFNLLSFCEWEQNRKFCIFDHNHLEFVFPYTEITFSGRALCLNKKERVRKKLGNSVRI